MSTVAGLILQPLTNGAFWPRTMKPTVLLCVHVTANARTSAEPSGVTSPGQAAYDEWHYADRAGSGGPSAHDYLNRDGTGIEALDPRSECAWSNGDVNAPNLAIATVAAAVKAGTNPNRIVYREVECVGYSAAYPVTDAQLDTCARLVAADHAATGLPIDRTTVTTHADWNSVDRASCAFPAAAREQRLAYLIARARQFAEEPPMRTFAITGPSGTATVKADSQHFGVPLDAVTPFQKLAAGQQFASALPIHLAAAIPGGLPGENRIDGYLVVVGAVPCVLLAKDADFTDDVAAAIAADRAKAHVAITVTYTD